MLNLLLHTKDITNVENYDFSNLTNVSFFRKLIGRTQKNTKVTAKSIRDFFSTEGDMYWKIDDPNFSEKWKNFQWQPLLDFSETNGNAPVFTELVVYKVKSSGTNKITQRFMVDGVEIFSFKIDITVESSNSISTTVYYDT